MSHRPALASYYFAFFTVMGAYFPYMPTWYQQRGLSGLEIGALSALMPTMSVLSPPLFGMLADALGLRGSMIRRAALGACLSLLLLCAVVSFWTVSFALLFGCVLMFTFFRTPMSQIADVIALEHPGDYGRVRLWGSIGFLLSALCVGRWVPLDPAWPLPAVGALGLFVAWFVSFKLPARSGLPPVAVFTEARRLWSQKGFKLFVLSAALGQAAHAGYDWSISLHLQDLGADGSAIGLAWAIGTGAEVLMLLFSERLLKHSSLSVALCCALAASVLRWALLAQVSSVNQVLLLQPLHALTFAARWVCCLQLLRGFAEPRAMATAQGMFLGIFSTGSALGMLASGALYDLGKGPLVFSWSAGLALLALLTTLPLCSARALPALSHQR